MNYYISGVPVWVSTLFIISFFSSVILISQQIKMAFLRSCNNESQAIKLRNKVVVFYLFFLGTVGMLSLFGLFAVNTLPPKILLFSALPLFLFYTLLLPKLSWYKAVFNHVKISELVAIHLFRFVGVFFLINESYGALPSEFAKIGGWGDLFSAVLAIPVIYAWKKKKDYAKTITWVWNIVGLLDIISVIITAMITTKLSLENGTEGVLQFTYFPFSWIPAFAPATIIFLHILIFKKLRKNI